MGADPKSHQEALARLTGPGAPFELRIEEVRGRPMRNFALRDSGSRLLMVDERLHPRVQNLVGEVESLKKVLFSGAAAPAGTLPLRELIQPHPNSKPLVEIDEDDPFAIVYTSGTTGRPKGCITTHRGTITQVMGIILHGMLAAALGEAGPLPSDGSQPTSLMTSPLFHVSGIHTGLCTAMAAGAKVVMNQGRFDPDQVLELIEREKVTTWGGIPTLLHRLVHSPNLARYDLSRMTRVTVGRASTTPETMAQAARVLPVEPGINVGFGITETHGIVMMNGVPDPELGERVKAVVRRSEGSRLDEAGVRRHVGASLAAFKVPELVEFTDALLPRNPAGKILKDQLRGRGRGAFDPDLMD